MSKKIIILIAVFSTLLFSTGPAWAGTTEFKITPDDSDRTGEYFGRAVSIDGDYAIIGANGDYVDGWMSGSAYVFYWDGTAWIQQAKLAPGDPTDSIHFGWTAAISGDYAVVGAWNQGVYGAVYIFHRNGVSWTQQAKLTPSGGTDGMNFGIVVSISGDYVIVGADRDDAKGNSSGSAYIFHRSGTSWTQQAKLTAGDGAADDMFGSSVSISGDYAIIGADYNDDSYPQSGSAYVFKRNGTSWAQQAKLTASDPAEGNFFGCAVSIDGEYAVVGAFSDDANHDNSGSAYIFKRDGTSWSQQDKLTATAGQPEHWFGHSVSINGELAVIGSYYVASSAGSAYIFKRQDTEWTQQYRLAPTDGVSNDRFGWSASISGDRAIIGAYQADPNGSNTGSAYIYSLQGSATLTLTPDNTAPVIGDTLCVGVDIADVQTLYSAAFDLSYDPAALEYQSSTEGSFLNADGGATFFEASLLNDDPAGGIVVVGVSRVSDIGEVSGSGRIANACFTVIGGSGSDVSIGLENGYFEGSEPGTGIEVVESGDPSVPVEIGIPAGLTIADPGTLDRLDLSWDAASDASGYEIYRADASGGSFELLGTSTGTSYQDTDCILLNVAYYYKVKAISASGSTTGDFSVEASGTAAGLAGDINKDNRVDGRDLTILARAFNTVQGDAGYTCQANLDRISAIDGDDLVILTAGFGDKL